MYTKLSIRPQLNISAQLVMISKLLQVHGSELEKFITQELTNNPALELANQGNIIQRKNVLSASGFQFNLKLIPSSMGSSHDSSSFEEMVENIPNRPSSIERLTDQVSIMLNKGDREIAIQLLYRLDHRGFLAISAEQVASELSVSEEMINRVVKILHQLDPPGIGARDIQECFLIQCDHLEAQGIDCQQVRSILTLAWNEFLHQQWDRVARKIQGSKKTIEDACEFMRLNFTPNPMAMMESSSETADALGYPDLIILQDNHPGTSNYLLEIPGESDFELRISTNFQKMLDSDAKAKDGLSLQERSWIKIHSDRAGMVISALCQRWKTLRRLGEYLIVHQRDFLEHGPLHLKPMTRALVAQELNVHESTISRAVNEKIIQLPNGHLIPLNNLFDPSLAGKEAVRKLLHDNPKHISDRKIAEILQGRGMNLSRRTITKYRHELNISSSRQQPMAL
jgi:RNA polymerase sigma-54 factor